MRNLTCLCIAVAFLGYACGGGGGGGSSSDGSGSGGGGTPPPATASTVVLAANDLGMHCMDREFSIFSILPPFNVVNAQIIGRDADGNPVLLDDLDVDVRYGATTDALGSINSYSRGKTDFWSYANSLFGASLLNGEGLTGLFMPADDPQNRGAQPMAYIPASDWFRAEGIPITPTDDGNRSNPYPLMEVSAHNKQTAVRPVTATAASGRPPGPSHPRTPIWKSKASETSSNCTMPRKAHHLKTPPRSCAPGAIIPLRWIWPEPAPPGARWATRRSRR